VLLIRSPRAQPDPRHRPRGEQKALGSKGDLRDYGAVSSRDPKTGKAPGKFSSAHGADISFENLIENASTPVVMFGRDEVCLYGNRAAAAALLDAGCVGDITGRPLAEVVPQPLTHAYERVMREVCLTGMARSLQYERVGASGTRWHLADIQPMRGKDGKIVGTYITTHDISERRTIELTLRDHQAGVGALLEQAPVAVAEIDVADSLRYARMQTAQTSPGEWLSADPEAPRHFVSRARWLRANAAAAVLLDAADEPETLAAFESAPSEAFDVIRTQIFALLTGQEQVSSLAVVRTSRGALREVVCKVGVAAGHDGTVSRLVLSLVDVSDNAVLKERFVQTQRVAAVGKVAAQIGHEINNPLTYTYTNLELIHRRLAGAGDLELQRLAKEALKGCSRVRKIARELRSCAASTDQRGASPLATASPAVAPEQVDRAVVLVVDDEQATLRSIKIVLSDHDVDVAASAQEALELLQARRYDVVLCDLIMPEMTGMALYGQILARDPAQAQRFVFMTGGAYTAGAREFVKTTSNLQLPKPFDVDELLAVLRSCLAAAKPS
jgi:CheY-like chemotaxis protein/PAS domain-containing protein